MMRRLAKHACRASVEDTKRRNRPQRCKPNCQFLNEPLSRSRFCFELQLRCGVYPWRIDRGQEGSEEEGRQEGSPEGSRPEGSQEGRPEEGDEEGLRLRLMPRP